MTNPTRSHLETRITERVHHLGFHVGNVVRLDVKTLTTATQRITAKCAECHNELDAHGVPVPDDDHGPRRYHADMDAAAQAVAKHSTTCDDMLAEMAWVGRRMKVVA